MNIDNILQKLNIESLNEMQIDVARAVSMTDGDITVLSPTGSGKTLAYLMPAVFQLNPIIDATQMAVIVPTRELAKQSLEVLRSMGIPLRGLALYGGRPAMEEHKEIDRVKPHIIFATPGRINDHIAKGNINVKGVKILVIDEFDKCLEMGFSDEMRRAMDSMKGVQRRILLSATDCDDIPNFVNMQHVRRIDYTKPNSGINTAERIKSFVVKSDEKDKLDTLSRLLLSFGDKASIVFLNYRNSVERTYSYLQEQGFVCSMYHGGLDQRQREDNLYKFSNGSASVLVSTDLASRGLDIPDVDNIIHYHLPQGEAEYTHRVGRTARWDAEGRTFLLLGPQESLPEYVDQDMPVYPVPTGELPVPKPRMATLYIGKGKKDKVSKSDVLGFLCKKCGLSGNEIGRIDVTDRYCYAAVLRSKMNSVLRLAAGEKIKGIKTVVEAVR